MFQFTNDGEAVTTPLAHEVEAQVESLVGSDITYLPIMIRAAIEADAQGYCHVYDQIAEAVGAPTRDELKEAGLIPMDTFTATITRTVRVNLGEIDVPVNFTVRNLPALRPGDLRDESRWSEATHDAVEAAWQAQNGEGISGSIVRGAINYYQTFETIEVEGDEFEVQSVERD